MTSSWLCADLILVSLGDGLSAGRVMTDAGSSVRTGLSPEMANWSETAHLFCSMLQPAGSMTKMVLLSRKVQVSASIGAVHKVTKSSTNARNSLLSTARVLIGQMTSKRPQHIWLPWLTEIMERGELKRGVSTAPDQLVLTAIGHMVAITTIGLTVARAMEVVITITSNMVMTAMVPVLKAIYPLAVTGYMV